MALCASGVFPCGYIADGPDAFRQLADETGVLALTTCSFPEVETALSKALEQVPRMDTSTILPRFATQP